LVVGGSGSFLAVESQRSAGGSSSYVYVESVSTLETLEVGLVQLLNVSRVSVGAKILMSRSVYVVLNTVGNCVDWGTRTASVFGLRSGWNILWGGTSFAFPVQLGVNVSELSESGTSKVSWLLHTVVSRLRSTGRSWLSDDGAS